MNGCVYIQYVSKNVHMYACMYDYIYIYIYVCMYACKEIKICVHLQSYNYDCHLVEQNNYIYERVQILILQNNEKNQYVRLEINICREIKWW